MGLWMMMDLRCCPGLRERLTGCLGRSFSGSFLCLDYYFNIIVFICFSFFPTSAFLPSVFSSWKPRANREISYNLVKPPRPYLFLPANGYFPCYTYCMCLILQSHSRLIQADFWLAPALVSDRSVPHRSLGN